MAQPAQSYAELCDALAAAGISSDCAELHGGLCASLCIGGVRAAQAWLEEWMRDSSSEPHEREAAEEALRVLENRTWEALNAGEFGLRLMLPEDDADLAERVEALASWCQGFLSGLGLAGFKIRHDESEDTDAMEIIRDFAEISRAAVDKDDSESQRNEADFQLAQLVEYVRVGAQIVFEGLAARRQNELSQKMH